MITLKNITKTYGGAAQVQALKGIDLTINDGEIFGIIGKSGAGKSTLVRCINMLEKPTSGQVIIDDKDLTKMNESQLRAERKNIGMIFQHFNLLSSRTVAENIAFPLELVGASKDIIEKKVASLLELVNLTDRAGNYPSQLSGGQKQRVGIARALAVDPECVFCDEPISALDVSVQVQIVNMMQRLQQERGLSYLFIAHDLAMVHHMSRRMGVMYLGRLVELGQGDEVFHEPLHPYTQMLIASVPRPDPHYRRRTIVCGEVPSPLDLPKGCVFHPRCPYADEVCRLDVPHLHPAGDGRFVACHHARGGNR